MADDLIHCPACNFELRLPPELYGSPVECPRCHTRFTAPAPAVRPAADRPPPGREYDASAPVAQPAAYGEPPAGRSGLLVAPAICLLVTALLGLWVYGQTLATMIQIQKNPAALDEVRQEIKRQNPNFTPEQNAQMEQILSAMRAYGVTVCGVLLGLNLITALGAIQMLRRRTYGLAIVAALLALNPVNLPCCVLQLPFGIWALVVLLRGDVRIAFR